MVPAETDDSRFDEPPDPTRGKILPFGSRRSPDWLTGPGEDPFEAADPPEGAVARDPGAALPRPVLVRPAALAPPSVPAPGARAGPAGAGSGLDEPDEPARADGVVENVGAWEPVAPRPSPPGAAWAPAASSVPIVRLALPTEPGASGAAPSPRRPVRPAGLPGCDEDLVRAAAPPPALVPLDEPWWLVALDALRSSRRVQLVVGGLLACAVLLPYWMWPRGVGSTPLAEVRRHPTRYDGRVVVVRGRVGDDVFAVGSGWAFYLMQGRDTIVAFSRNRTPLPREIVTVKGQVSTGFLDGAPRQALFEDPAAPH
jgi:hypothetical protein